MLLAVAGLEDKEIAERTSRLASGDWSSFTAPERAAFHFARKQAQEPWSITADDVNELAKYFGPERTIDVIWWSCRCHYMTRVADAFQLPLERENVFAPAGQGAERQAQGVQVITGGYGCFMPFFRPESVDGTTSARSHPVNSRMRETSSALPSFLTNRAKPSSRSDGKARLFDRARYLPLAPNTKTFSVCPS